MIISSLNMIKHIVIIIINQITHNWHTSDLNPSPLTQLSTLNHLS